MGFESMARAIPGDRVWALWSEFRGRRLGLVGLGIIIAAIVLAVFAQGISPYDPFGLGSDLLAPPSSGHWLGTDELGRDVLSRTIWGARVALLFGMGSAGLSLLIGLLLGAVSGYFGGWTDEVFSRFVEMFLMIPQLFLLIVIVAFYGSDVLLTATIVGLTIWPSNARIARAQVLSLKQRPFVQALRGLGASHARILFRHILPNGVAPVIVNSTQLMAYAILIEAGLSFLGLGDARFVSWGHMILRSQFYVGSAWWMAVFPGLAISILVFGFYAFGDALNAALNPKESHA